MRNSIHLLLFLLFLSPAVGKAQDFIGSSKQIDIIMNNINLFSKNVMAGDHEAIAKMYVEDAKIFPPKSKIIEGQEAIGKFWEMPKGRSIVEHKVTPIGIKIVGKEAIDHGTYIGKTRNADGSEISWAGKYVMIWRKVGKNWKLHLDIWNRTEE